jgi:hypothetical protein
MKYPTKADLLSLPDKEKAARFNAMVEASFSHVDERDLLAELHPRNTIDIKRRVDGHETWFEGDWLSKLEEARDGWKLPPKDSIPNGRLTT